MLYGCCVKQFGVHLYTSHEIACTSRWRGPQPVGATTECFLEAVDPQIDTARNGWLHADPKAASAHSALTRSTRMWLGRAYECGFPAYEAPRSTKEALRWYQMVAAEGRNGTDDTEARAAIKRLGLR